MNKFTDRSFVFPLPGVVGPAGETGSAGPTGPAGPAGETGPAGSDANLRGPFPYGNIFLSEDGLLDIDGPNDGAYNIAIGNGAMHDATICNATVAVGYHAGYNFDGEGARTGVFIGHVCGEFVGESSSNTFVGGYAGRGFEVDTVTGEDISGTHPLTGDDNCLFGEAAGISIRGNASFNCGFGFNALFSQTYASSNSAFGNGAGSMVTGISEDTVASGLNTMIGISAYRWGNGAENTMVGAQAGGGDRTYTTLAGAVAKGDTVIKVADTTVFAVGYMAFSGGFLTADTVVTAVTPGGSGLTAPAGTITVSKASFGDFASGVPLTIYSVPNQHTGLGNVGVGYNALGLLSGAADYNIALGVSAGKNITGGDDNIYIGRSSGLIGTTGSKNVVIGSLSDIEVATDSNTLNIGNTIYAKNIAGGTPGSVGIGLLPSAIGAKLDVNGTFRSAGVATFQSGIVRTVRVVTAAGGISMNSADDIVTVKKSVGAATAIILPPSPTTGHVVVVKDGKGDAATNNITITPAAGTVDGAANKVINSAYGFLHFVYNGTEWNTL